jgi:O-antigen/teichoic acid export membrane protein
MSVTRGLLRNAGVQFLSQAATWVLGWVFTYYLARHQGDAGFGRLFTALSLSMMAGIAVDIGLNTFLVKEIARAPASAARSLANALGIKLALAGVAYLGLVSIVRMLDVAPETVIATDVVGLSFMVSAIGLTFGACLQGLQRSSVPAIGLVIEKALVTALSVAALALGYGLVVVAWIFLAGALANAAYQGWVLSRYVPLRPRFERDEIVRV